MPKTTLPRSVLREKPAIICPHNRNKILNCLKRYDDATSSACSLPATCLFCAASFLERSIFSPGQRIISYMFIFCFSKSFWPLRKNARSLEPGAPRFPSISHGKLGPGAEQVSRAFSLSRAWIFVSLITADDAGLQSEKMNY